MVETPGFLAAAKAAGVPDSVRREIVTAVASRPELGELVVGTGGLRKFRVARLGAGKSGGFRVLSYYLGENFPVFLIGVFAKNQKDNLTAAERVEVAKRLKTVTETYGARTR